MQKLLNYPLTHLHRFKDDDVPITEFFTICLTIYETKPTVNDPLSSLQKNIEPDFNETTRRYVCPVCAAPVDAQVLIEKKKCGLK